MSVNVTGPLPGTAEGSEYIVLCQDRFTKWLEGCPLRKVTPTTITKASGELVIMRYGCPATLITDNGTEFDNKKMRDMLRLYNIRHQRTPPYTPQTNLVECANRIFKSMMAQFCDKNNRAWDI